MTDIRTESDFKEALTVMAGFILASNYRTPTQDELLSAIELLKSCEPYVLTRELWAQPVEPPSATVIALNAARSRRKFTIGG